jgi:acyl-CoA thioester hydrolase
MKPPTISVKQVTLLQPVCLRISIPQSYEDANGHMNVRWYIAIFDDSGDTLHAHLGLTPAYHREHRSGTMDLEHHLSFLNEVLVGDQIAVYARLVGRSTKLIHYVMFMVNETNGQLAALFECVNAFVNLDIRKTAPYPADIAERIDQLVAEHQRHDWSTPVCGAMKV